MGQWMFVVFASHAALLCSLLLCCVRCVAVERRAGAVSVWTRDRPMSNICSPISRIQEYGPIYGKPCGRFGPARSPIL